MRRRSTDTQGAYLLRWSRWDAYQRAGDGWIYPASLGREKYDPTQQPALPTELARVAHPYRRARAIQQFTEASMSKDNDSGDCDTILVSTGSMNYKWTAIVRFLTQFGHLGQTELQEPLEVRRFKREGNVFYPAGDHIGWFLEHAQHVRTCLALIAALNASKFSDERERGRRVLRHIEEPRPERVGWPWLTPTLEKSYQPVFPRMLYEPDDSEDVKARALLREFLRPNLGMVERGYDTETGRTVFSFKALIQLIYWQLADWVDGGRLRQCAECQTPFRAADGRQRFCPPPSGVHESRCARRARERARREKKGRG